jgi:hypothetical protein
MEDAIVLFLTKAIARSDYQRAGWPRPGRDFCAGKLPNTNKVTVTTNYSVLVLRSQVGHRNTEQSD